MLIQANQYLPHPRLKSTYKNSTDILMLYLKFYAVDIVMRHYGYPSLLFSLQAKK